MSQDEITDRRLLLSIADAAHALGVCPRTVQTLIADGRLAVVRIGRRALVPWQSIYELAGRRNSECHRSAVEGSERGERA